MIVTACDERNGDPSETELIVEARPGVEGGLGGTTVNYRGNQKAHGRSRSLSSDGEEYEPFDLIVTCGNGFSVRLVGRLVKEGEELVGRWGSFSEEGDATSAFDAHPFDYESLIESKTFVFRRTPVEVAGFRHILNEGENKAKARWTFLRESVLHLIRRRLWSWSYFKTWSAERSKCLDFHKRNGLRSTRNFVTLNPLTQSEKEEWNNLKYRLPPSNIRLCIESLNWSLSRLPYHL